MSSEGPWGSPKADLRATPTPWVIATFAMAKIPPLNACRRSATVHIAHVNGTAKLARRESVCETADNAERSLSLGPACAAAGRQGPRTAAKRTGSSNLARFFCYIKDLLAEGVGFEPSVCQSIALHKPLNSLINSGWSTRAKGEEVSPVETRLVEIGGSCCTLDRNSFR